MQQQARDVAGTWQAIDELEFDRIKAKLLHRKESGWTPGTVARAEHGYRQFLKLSAKYPTVTIVPGEGVDQFWHAHILDTQRYASDCERLFGYVLHHSPYVGIDGADDEAHLQELAATTGELMVREFGAASADTPAYCAITPGAEAKPAYCAITPGAQAKPAYCAVTPTHMARTTHAPASAGCA
ncbi:glycine-rich domain-containing protein [Paraburkholderia sp. RL17-373-BIF-A]|uniref:glycine-rich domain-containing protein n=1 Tax=Paraburkholderia sp. RL17-373-BIF-A TaxID=3031629 RepID=UPI0038BAF07B